MTMAKKAVSRKPQKPSGRRKPGRRLGPQEAGRKAVRMFKEHVARKKRIARELSESAYRARLEKAIKDHPGVELENNMDYFKEQLNFTRRIIEYGDEKEPYAVMPLLKIIRESEEPSLRIVALSNLRRIGIENIRAFGRKTEAEVLNELREIVKNKEGRERDSVRNEAWKTSLLLGQDLGYFESREKPKRKTRSNKG